MVERFLICRCGFEGPISGHRESIYCRDNSFLTIFDELEEKKMKKRREMEHRFVHTDPYESTIPCGRKHVYPSPSIVESTNPLDEIMPTDAHVRLWYWYKEESDKLMREHGIIDSKGDLVFNNELHGKFVQFETREKEGLFGAAMDSLSAMYNHMVAELNKKESAKKSPGPSLSVGEKMVWAAAFVAEFLPAFRNPGPICSDSEKWAQWEIDLAQGCAETARGAVGRMRDAMVGVVEGFGEDDDVTQMLRAMLGEGDD